MKMSKIRVFDEFDPKCPVRNILSRVGDKWSMLVLCTLNFSGVMRFKELQRAVPDISQKMLTVTLRTLEEDGLVERKVYPQVPPRVEYTLTERSHSLLPHIMSLIEWAKANMSEVMADHKSRVA